MIFHQSFGGLPVVKNIYKIERKTVWQTADENNIVILILNGSCLFETGAQKITANKGDFIFLPADEEYIRKPLNDKPCTFCYIHFETKSSFEAIKTEDAEKLLEKYKTDKKGENIIFLNRKISLDEIFEEISNKFTKILDEGYKNDVISQSIMNVMLLEILLTVTRKTLFKSFTKNDILLESEYPAKLEKALTYIKLNKTKEISLDTLAKHCNISVQHLIRLFHSELNTTPTKYINKMRIFHARDLMQKNNSLSVKEVAYEMGFLNPNYFSRLFLSICGETPTQYKEKLKKPESAYVNGIIEL